jgi:hypothetical protein
MPRPDCTGRGIRGRSSSIRAPGQDDDAHASLEENRRHPGKRGEAIG